ncbi:hypothetical protein HYW75_02375 [Candidatus Pacearchaeota archaeon]|nr:hypothetical protein [Candidatus Pacearchaeota archaeon]
MDNQIELEVQRGRTWLTTKYNNVLVKFAYPPVQGTQQECFTAINHDTELRPAEGLELALLTYGAYNGKESEWQDVRKDCFQGGYTRVSVRNLWIPKKTFSFDPSLSGVLVENDLQGECFINKMQVPDLSNSDVWVQNEEGVYVSKNENSKFIPESKHKLGEHTKDTFAKDNYAQTKLTPEGAELFAKTAFDKGKKLWIYGVDINSISSPVQWASVLGEDSYRLGIGVWVDNRYYRAFGVFSKTGEASPKKI